MNKPTGGDQRSLSLRWQRTAVKTAMRKTKNMWIICTCFYRKQSNASKKKRISCIFQVLICLFFLNIAINITPWTCYRGIIILWVFLNRNIPGFLVISMVTWDPFPFCDQSLFHFHLVICYLHRKLINRIVRLFVWFEHINIIYFD